MDSGSFRFWILLVVGCVAVTAAVYDLRQRRIPDALTLPAVLAGLIVHAARSGWGGFAYSLLGLATGGGLLLLFLLFGGMGAGDVKLMAAIGAMGGFHFSISVLVLTGVAGGIMALTKILMWRLKSRDKGNEVKPSAHATDLRSGDSALKQTMPYGVAIAAGVLASIILIMVSGGSS